jgi:RHS repeat-associated protein
VNDLPVAVVDGVNAASPTLYYVHTDHLGRPARMVAQNWAWAWDVIYSPFGAVSAIWDGTSKLDMRFPGQWFQLESGLAYNWHRHYDATIGRYVQADPIGLRGGKNLFSYVNQNPLAYTDADGLEAIAAMSRYGWGLDPAEGPQLECAWAAFRANFSDMTTANTVGADKYFHCKANCAASKCGDFGRRQACFISDAREFTDDYFKDPYKRLIGDSKVPASYSASKRDSFFDQLANEHGRNGGANSCRDTCAIYRPRGLDSKY